MLHNVRSRIRPFFIHLVASVLVIALFWLLLRGLWYPDFYFELERVWQVVKLIILVDLVLGPLLTFIVYDLRKGLTAVRRDIAVIVLVQLLALGWGVRTTFLGHPTHLAYMGGAFYTVTQGAIIGELAPEFEVEPWQPPMVVYIRPVSDGAERTEQLLGFLGGRLPDLQYQADRYLNYQQHITAVRKNGVGADRLDTAARKQFDALIQSVGGKGEDYRLYTVLSASGEGILVISVRDGSLAGYLDAVLS